MTNEERNLLKKKATGALDGFVGDDLTISGGSTVWKVIKNGVPAMFKQGPGSRFFNPTAKLALLLCVALEKKFEDLFYF